MQSLTPPGTARSGHPAVAPPLPTYESSGIPSWFPTSPEGESPGSPCERRNWLFTHARLAEPSVVDGEGERSALAIGLQSARLRTTGVDPLLRAHLIKPNDTQLVHGIFPFRLRKPLWSSSVLSKSVGLCTLPACDATLSLSDQGRSLRAR